MPALCRPCCGLGPAVPLGHTWHVPGPCRAACGLSYGYDMEDTEAWEVVDVLGLPLPPGGAQVRPGSGPAPRSPQWAVLGAGLSKAAPPLLLPLGLAP